MSYCTLNDMRRVLPPNILIGDTNLGTPTVGSNASKSNISVADAYEYIQYGEEYVDGRLRPFYLCPLRQVKTFEADVLANIASGSSIPITIVDTSVFSQGMGIRIQDKSRVESATITEILGASTIQVDSVINNFYADETKISIIGFPDPIKVITARLAVSFAFDTLYVETQAPDVSTYGKTQRNLARNAVDDILSGEILLLGQERTGRRFVRGQLLDAYNSPAEINKGEEKE